jgi:hypothetical protein
MSHQKPDAELMKELREFVHEQRETNRFLRKILQAQQAEDGFLYQISSELQPKPITGFTFKEISMLPIDPGQTGIKFQATPTPAGAVLPTGAVLVWASNDPNITAVADTTDTTGLTVDISIAAAATVGEAAVITLTATGTNADGTALSATGSFTLTVGAAPAQNVTGFTFAQVA